MKILILAAAIAVLSTGLATAATKGTLFKNSSATPITSFAPKSGTAPDLSGFALRGGGNTCSQPPCALQSPIVPTLNLPSVPVPAAGFLLLSGLGGLLFVRFRGKSA